MSYFIRPLHPILQLHWKVAVRVQRLIPLVCLPTSLRFQVCRKVTCTKYLPLNGYAGFGQCQTVIQTTPGALST